MDIYNSIIKQTEALLSASVPVTYDYSPDRVWPESPSSELIMLKESALELGGSGRPAVNFTCITSDTAFEGKDQVLVFGPELSSLRSDSCYARITVLTTDSFDKDSTDTEKTLRTIQGMDFIKYHVFPKGFMLRISSESNREQVRVSRDAMKRGISFERIGNTFISHYKKDPHVKNVRVIFITDPGIDYSALTGLAKNVHDITMTLSKILEGMPTDCATCGLKPICDEVEGMKELHFGKKKS